MDNPVFQLIRSIYRILRAFVFYVGFVVIFGVIFFLYKNFSLEKPEYSATDKIFLKLPLRGELLSKSPDTSSFSQTVLSFVKEEEEQLYVFHLKALLERAKEDPQVLGLYLDMGALSGSLTEFELFRTLLSDFKAGGKRIEVWGTQLDNKMYYLSSLADRLHLAPEGLMQIPGPMFEFIYGGEAFRKLGVAFDIVKVGQYKSAFEPFVSDQPSEDTQKEYLSIEENIRKHLVAKVANGRKVEVKLADSWFRRSLYSAKEAFLEKMIDGVSYREQFEDVITKEGKIIEIAKYPMKETPKLSKSEGIAFIEAVGEMFLENSSLNAGSMMDFEHLEEELKWAREDKDVKAVVLRVDSPGGSALAADLLWEDVRKLAETKPVVVTMGAYAASGGYYMSAPATKIIAHPTTITGSIGVIGLVPNFEAFKQKYGVSFHTITGSDRRNLFNPGSRMTAEDRAILEKQTRTTYEAFVTKVASGRKKSFTEIDSIAQGRVWTGQQALELGLVDELGGLPEAFHKAKELAKLNVDEKYPVLLFESPRGTWRKFLSRLPFGKLSNVPTNLEKLPFLNFLSRYLEGNSKEQILSLLPRRVEVR